MSKESAIRERLKEMAKLTIISGRISEIQEKNLKAYPFVFFNDVKSVTIDYDLSRKVPKYKPESTKLSEGELPSEEETATVQHKVTFRLTVGEGNYESSQVNIEKRFFCIEEAVRSLFWKDIKVQVYFNNKLAYESADE